MMFKYPIRGAERSDVLASAAGRCMICGDSPEPTGQRRVGLVIDHCHDTGWVRGVICQPCNVGLGGFKDRIDALFAAVAYLQAANVRIRDAEFRASYVSPMDAMRASLPEGAWH